MLTDIALRNLKTEASAIKRADGGGLFILVKPHGNKIWRIAYRLEGQTEAFI